MPSDFWKGALDAAIYGVVPYATARAVGSPMPSVVDSVEQFGSSVRDSLEQYVSTVKNNGLLPTFVDGLNFSGQKALDFLLGPDAPNLSDINLDDLLGGDVSADSPGSSLQPETFQYLNAELSKAYGMDRNTAYQEALSNTAYQRAVADMQRAGLNPAAIFGAGRGSTAGGVSFIGSSSSGSGTGSAKSGLFSQDQYHGLAAITGLITAIATKDPSKYYLGSTAAQGVMSALNALDQSVK